jgi:hypothetical protein
VTQSRLRAEWICVIVLLAILAVWLALPPIAQDQSYHAFADQRSWLRIPRAADVLSNAAFVLVGALGIARLASRRRVRFPPATEASLWCVAAGLVCTGIGSAWYHMNPNDATLAWDRLPMTIVFAGIFGAALAQRIGQNVARMALPLLLVLGVASVVYWRQTGDLSLYVVLQFGGIAALLVLLVITRGIDDPFRWWWLIAWYALAKMFEAGDVTLFKATNGLVAGHALKHLAAAIAGVALFLPLRERYRETPRR